MQKLYLLFMTCICLVISGCTMVTIHGAEGTVDKQHGFGVFNLYTQPGEVPQIISMAGFGVVSQNNSITLGYAKSEYALLPMDSCRLVIWLTGEETDYEQLNSIINAKSELCIAGPGAKDFMEKRQ